MSVPRGHAVYRDQVGVRVEESGGLTFHEASLPPGIRIPDESRDGELREQYDMDFVIVMPVTAHQVEPGLLHTTLLVHQQGCGKGICYPPETEVLVVTVPVREPPKRKSAAP
mgnify:CR=1 FL=1